MIEVPAVIWWLLGLVLFSLAAPVIIPALLITAVAIMVPLGIAYDEIVKRINERKCP